ncbi:MAG: peptidoglycan-binding protein, partial [bacterium]
MKKILLSIFVFSLMFSFAIKTWAMPTDRYVSEVPPRTLMVGIKGSDVQVLQQALIDKGFLSGKADGSFGQKTRMALIAFQKANNLKLDGKAGTQTFKLLNTDKQASVGCTPASTPSITILSPSGGEVFIAGQQITVKWKSCNVQNLYISWATGGHDLGSLSEAPIAASLGSYQWTLPSSLALSSYSNNAYVIGIESESPSVALVKSNSFTINTSTISTTLPQYVGTHSDCDGQSQCWPPIISNSATAYSCTTKINSGDGVNDVIEKSINNRTYCVKRLSDGYAGGIGWTYTYTTPKIGGIKTTTFGLTYQSCGVYGGPTDPIVIQCHTNQNNFANNLDNLIDSLMQ